MVDAVGRGPLAVVGRMSIAIGRRKSNSSDRTRCRSEGTVTRGAIIPVPTSRRESPRSPRSGLEGRRSSYDNRVPFSLVPVKQGHVPQFTSPPPREQTKNAFLDYLMDRRKKLQKELGETGVALPVATTGQQETRRVSTATLRPFPEPFEKTEKPPSKRLMLEKPPLFPSQSFRDRFVSQSSHRSKLRAAHSAEEKCQLHVIELISAKESLDALNAAARRFKPYREEGVTLDPWRQKSSGDRERFLRSREGRQRSEVEQELDEIEALLVGELQSEELQKSAADQILPAAFPENKQALASELAILQALPKSTVKRADRTNSRRRPRTRNTCPSLTIMKLGPSETSPENTKTKCPEQQRKRLWSGRSRKTSSDSGDESMLLPSDASCSEGNDDDSSPLRIKPINPPCVNPWGEDEPAGKEEKRRGERTGRDLGKGKGLAEPGGDRQKTEEGDKRYTYLSPELINRAGRLRKFETPEERSMKRGLQYIRNLNAANRAYRLRAMGSPRLSVSRPSIVVPDNGAMFLISTRGRNPFRNIANNFPENQINRKGTQVSTSLPKEDGCENYLSSVPFPREEELKQFLTITSTDHSENLGQEPNSHQVVFPPPASELPDDVNSVSTIDSITPSIEDVSKGMVEGLNGRSPESYLDQSDHSLSLADSTGTITPPPSAASDSKSLEKTSERGEYPTTLPQATSDWTRFWTSFKRPLSSVDFEESHKGKSAENSFLSQWGDDSKEKCDEIDEIYEAFKRLSNLPTNEAVNPALSKGEGGNQSPSSVIPGEVKHRRMRSNRRRKFSLFPETFSPSERMKTSGETSNLRNQNSHDNRASDKEGNPVTSEERRFSSNRSQATDYNEYKFPENVLPTNKGAELPRVTNDVKTRETLLCQTNIRLGMFP